MIQFNDFDSIAGFHGHKCPGLAIGYRAALAAMPRIEAERSAKGDELAVISENSSCAVDAIQFISGCTTGKGNLIINDYGKMVFSWFNKKNGKSLRMYADPSDLTPFFSQRGTISDPAELRKLTDEAVLSILEAPEELLFTITEPSMPAPEKAIVEPSSICFDCGEKCMRSRIIEKNGKDLCPTCWLEEG